MARLYDMAQMTVSSTGAGTISLGSAAVAAGVTYLTFAQAGAQTGDILSYRIIDTLGAWEVGRGVYTAGTPPTLTRGMLFSSTGSVLSITNQAVVMIAALGEDFFAAPSVSWLAGTNPNNAVLIVTNRALTITGVSAVVRVTSGGTAGTMTVDVRNGVGTSILPTPFDFTLAAAVYTRVPSITTLAAGDFLYLVTAGATWTASVGNVTVFMS